MCSTRAIHKPLSWYPRPDLLQPIFEEAKRVKRSSGAARKWLNTPCDRLGGRVPLEMAASDDGASELRAYMDAYAKEFGF
jgi:6-hydroxy-3-succinoylpyridine 3-monooxygenase